MPSLDDTPTLPPTVPTTDDLIAVVDKADYRSAKRASLLDVATATAGSFGAGAVISGVLNPVPGFVLAGGTSGRFRIRTGVPDSATTATLLPFNFGGFVFSNASSPAAVAGGGSSCSVPIPDSGSVSFDVTITNSTAHIQPLSVTGSDASTFPFSITRLS
jgi:hypothetical protein